MADIFLPVFLLSLVLLGIHSYYGIEIIRRGIIFTDLAIGQMAALGAAVSLLFLEERYLYQTSLLFALTGGLLIAFASKRIKNLEAFIGLLYAAGIAAVFILLSRSPHGMEEFQNLMASDILFTPVNEIIRIAVIYLLLGLVLYFINKKTEGFLKEVLFFVTFSITVTSSVKLAGVLSVFALLVAPALIATNIRQGNPVINAWIIGTVINLAAITVSFNFDLPTGYTLIFFHAFSAIVFTLFADKKEGDL